MHTKLYLKYKLKKQFCTQNWKFSSPMDLASRFISGDFDHEFFLQYSCTSDNENAMDLVHIPSATICLFDEASGTIDLRHWYQGEEVADSSFLIILEPVEILVTAESPSIAAAAMAA